jgi:hypothetical protein
VEHSATLAQDVNTLGGKLLHVDATAGLPDNPYWNGDPNANAEGLGGWLSKPVPVRPGGERPLIPRRNVGRT